MTDSISIKVNNIKKRLGINQALDDISIDFTPGQMHGIIGPEGAGKTTLMRIILQLYTPDEGEVVYRQNHANISFAAVRNSIAYMPERQSLYPDLSVEEHLDFFAQLYQIKAQDYEQRREELLQITKLKDFLKRPAEKLSGGMYKKLGLMCALLRQPKAILLDEPTNGVDPISRREFWDLLYHLLEQNILIIMTTAYMDEAERCSCVHLIEDGKLIMEGEPRELLLKQKASNFDQLFFRSKDTSL